MTGVCMHAWKLSVVRLSVVLLWVSQASESVQSEQSLSFSRKKEIILVSLCARRGKDLPRVTE